MMDERLSKVILLLALGWFLGYAHHYFSTAHEVEKLRSTSDALMAEIHQLQFDAPQKISVKTTAYSNDRYSINVNKWRDGRTATNKVARKGLVAADWGIFPPGTRFFIPGYGEAVVEDKGGLVKGYHLDLFVDSREEALQWGVQNLEVYVLEVGEHLQDNTSSSRKSEVELSPSQPGEPDIVVKTSY